MVSTTQTGQTDFVTLLSERVTFAGGQLLIRTMISQGRIMEIYPSVLIEFCLYFVNRKNEDGAKFIDESMSDIDTGKNKYFFIAILLY